MSHDRPILFTAFEPSGDALAAPVIAELKRRRPDQPVAAMGGPRMADAGADMIEITTGDPVMLAEAVGHVFEHRRRVNVLRRWMGEHDPIAVTPVDSPAANWATCRLARRMRPDAKIVHLVAPQLWAWGSWRIRKLRRLTDHVMCLLPFEPAWLEARGVKATFVSHPIFQDLPAALDSLPGDGEPKLALLPGSRSSEIKRNWPTMLAAYHDLEARYPAMRGVVAAADEPRRAQLAETAPGPLPPSMQVVTAKAGEVLAWADLSLTVSGTATLQTAAHGTPMVVLYNIDRLSWELVGRWVVRARPLSLPNVIGESMGLGSVAPELIPHFGAVRPVADALEPLMTDGQARISQRVAFDTIRKRFQDIPFTETAAATLLDQIDG